MISFWDILKYSALIKTHFLKLNCFAFQKNSAIYQKESIHIILFIKLLNLNMYMNSVRHKTSLNGREEFSLLFVHFYQL